MLLVLLLDVRGFLGSNPELLLGLSAAFAVLMVVPIPFPKIRRGHTLRGAMTATSVAFVIALLPLQFHLGRTTLPVVVGELATFAAAVGLASYYVVGPFTVPRAAAR